MRMHMYKVKQVASKILPFIGYSILGYVAVNMKRYYGNNYTNINVDFPFDEPFKTTKESCGNNMTFYGRAADAIMNSSMCSDDKRTALTSLKDNKNIGYYEAVISIANGTMSSYDKCVAICALSK